MTPPNQPVPAHQRVAEYDGAFWCLDCDQKWGALPGNPTETIPSTCRAPASSEPQEKPRCFDRKHRYVVIYACGHCSGCCDCPPTTASAGQDAEQVVQDCSHRPLIGGERERGELWCKPLVRFDGACAACIATALTRVRAEERERCAKVAESYQPDHCCEDCPCDGYGAHIAAALRPAPEGT